MIIVESRNEQYDTRTTRGYEKFVGGNLFFLPSSFVKTKRG